MKRLRTEFYRDDEQNLIEIYLVISKKRILEKIFINHVLNSWWFL